MRGDKVIKRFSRRRVIALMRKHKTQRDAAAAAGISRSALQTLVSRYGIKWEWQPPLWGNAAWQELGR